MKRDSNRNSRRYYSGCCARIMALLAIVMLSNGALRAQDHLLLSEITLQPSQAEFIEIFNPTNASIALVNYYMADNQTYPYLPGTPPALDLGDFIVKFPLGSTINSNEVVIIALNGQDFETYYGLKADFEIIAADSTAADMVVISQNTPTLSNDGEGIALFQWNGMDSTVKDVDLMNAGIPTSTSEILDKSSIPGYLPDAHTMPYQGHNGPAGSGFSTKRILFEGQYEISSGGNGITGHDETSEDISITWDEVYTSPTPGIANVTIGINDLNRDRMTMMKVFPNPCSTEVKIIVEGMADGYTLQICNLQGSVLEEIHTVSVNEMSLDVSKLETGLYMIRLISSTELIVRKLNIYR